MADSADKRQRERKRREKKKEKAYRKEERKRDAELRSQGLLPDEPEIGSEHPDDTLAEGESDESRSLERG